ncbi:uncharacterized protein [Physeter macrocephalus]|uniref:Uncharacterized protein n=1 Tax=Physeter macrocephalus TaxID=9755 RepID=A0A2Y9TDY7_PHYMC|nr:uncharacterized protein LOC112067098 [Physeter catodon]|eukprot:XP_023987817.1 uncharacterized protein LOC112067098 [Physeter catodon]
MRYHLVCTCGSIRTVPTPAFSPKQFNNLTSNILSGSRSDYLSKEFPTHAPRLSSTVSFLVPEREVPFTASVGHSLPHQKRPANWPGFTEAESQSIAGRDKDLTCNILKPRVKSTYDKNVEFQLNSISSPESPRKQRRSRCSRRQDGHTLAQQGKCAGERYKLSHPEEARMPPRKSLTKEACELPGGLVARIRRFHQRSIQNNLPLCLQDSDQTVPSLILFQTRLVAPPLPPKDLLPTHNNTAVI